MRAETHEDYRWRILQDKTDLTAHDVAAVATTRFGYELVLFTVGSTLTACDPTIYPCAAGAVEFASGPPCSGRVFVIQGGRRSLFH